MVYDYVNAISEISTRPTIVEFNNDIGKHISKYGYDSIILTESDIQALRDGKALIVDVLDEYSEVIILERGGISADKA